VDGGGCWWLAALLLTGLILPAARAAPAGRTTVVGTIAGTPMGTWMTLVVLSKKAPASYHVDLSNAKISEKGKALKRYDLVDGMKVRVTGAMRANTFAAETVVVLSRPAPKKK
jgi:hypothetical protein